MIKDLDLTQPEKSLIKEIKRRIKANSFYFDENIVKFITKNINSTCLKEILKM